MSSPGCSHARHAIAVSVVLSGAILFASCAARDTGAGENDLDAVPMISTEEILRIGSVDDPDYGFTAINGVDVDHDGNVYVLEGSAPEIRVYSPEGKLLRRIGRRGEGPGEFRGAPRFGIVGDKLWAIETSGRRISLFQLDGTVISTAPIRAVTVPVQKMIGNVMPASMREDGLFTSDMTMFSFARGEKIDIGENDTVPVPRVLFDPSGMPVDTVGWMPRLPPHQHPSERVNVGDHAYNVPQPPDDQPLFVTLQDGHIVIERSVATSPEPATLTITRLDLAGDTFYNRRFTYRPRPFDDAALDTHAWRSARAPGGFVRLINGVPTPDPVPDDSMDAFHRIRGAMHFPAFQPPVQRERLFGDDRIWLMREEDGGSTQRWTILDGDGRLVGGVALDRALYPLWSNGDTFFVVERDEFDVQWLVRYRMHIR